MGTSADNVLNGLEQHIRNAYDLVSRLDIAEPDLRREAFIYALQSGREAPAESAASAQTGTGSLHERLAASLDVSPELVELLYDESGGDLSLNIPTKLLPDSLSAAMREIGVLLAVGRKHAGLGSTTPFETVRTACEELGKLDKKNFAAALTGMKPRIATTGKGAQRELVPKKPADDWARDIIGRYGTFAG